MTYDIELTDMPAQETLVVRGETDPDSISVFLGGAFEEVMAAAGRQHLEIDGPPFGRYAPSESGPWTIEAGFPVAGIPEAEGRCERRSVPAGQVAITVHTGSYDGVAAAYDALSSWVDEHGLEVTDAPTERYLDPPTVPAPRTEILMPCQPTGASS